MKDRIIKTAIRLYTRYGIKAVGVNSIAAELHISKRTLYEYFPDKKRLVFECVQCAAERHKEELDRAEDAAVNPLEAVLAINKTTFGQLLQWCPAFFRDLECFPEAKLQAYDQHISSIWAKYIRNFFRCVDEGLFPHSVNMNMILEFFMTQIKTASEKYWSGQMNVSEVYVDSIFTFLAGVCTDRGRQELVKLQSAGIFKQ